MRSRPSSTTGWRVSRGHPHSGHCRRENGARAGATRKARDQREESALDAGNLPGKLADARYDPRSVSRDDSAGGSAKRGRDRSSPEQSSHFAVVINVERPASRVLEREIRTIIGDRDRDQGSRVDNARYHKALTTDADVDGAHIRTPFFFFPTDARPSGPGSISRSRLSSSVVKEGRSITPTTSKSVTIAGRPGAATGADP